MIGQLLDGRYRVIESLGAGGFGHTYIAENTRIPGNPKCVVKQLKLASNDPNTFAIAKRLFHSEAETLAKVGNHDQIPRILDFFDENQEFYLVQEYVEGHTLAVELTPGKKLSEAYAIALLQNILPILEFIHQQNPIVIHRDIKPANIIRRKQDGKLVLIDFGAVKEVKAVATSVQTEQSRASVVVGTLGYMAPEQARGKPRPISDIYALGMIAIQSLTGVSPEDLEEDPETGEMAWQQYASVSPGLTAVLIKMTCDRPQDRYQSATEVLLALEQLKNSPLNTAGGESTEVATQAGTQVYELTLEWREAGQLKTQIITDQQQTKNPGTVRIGRDPQACDLVLSEPTVSALHVEIYFHRQQQRFYLRNLRQSNPPVVDGQSLPTGEAGLNKNSTLRLGQLELKVSDIAVKLYPVGYQPTQYVTEPVKVPSHPIKPTVQPSKGEDIEVTLEISEQEATLGTSKEVRFLRRVHVNGNPSQETKTLIVNIPAYSQAGTRLQFSGQGNEGLYGGATGDVYVRLAVNRQVQPPASPPTPVPPQPKKGIPAWLIAGLATGTVLFVGILIRASFNPPSPVSDPPRSNSPDYTPMEQCMVITPAQGRTVARVREDHDRDAAVIRELYRGAQVTAIGSYPGFFKIRTSEGTTGWVFNSEVSDCYS